MLSRTLAFAFRSLPKNQMLLKPRLQFIQNRYHFTSSSDPTQVALLEEVEAKIFQVLKTAAKCNQSKLSRTATFEQLGFDSLDSVELVVAMEQYFGFDVPNEQAQKITNVEAAVNTFYRHMNAKIANKIVQNTGSSELKDGGKA